MIDSHTLASGRPSQTGNGTRRKVWVNPGGATVGRYVNRAVSFRVCPEQNR